MGLQFQPRLGSVILCDFRGMIQPEMVKRREVVVVAPHKHNSKLVTVVPLSSTPPRREEAYHHRLGCNPRPGGSADEKVWAKCDTVYTVCLERLDMHYTRTRRGGRQTVWVSVSSEELAAIRQALASALQIPYTAPVPERGPESESATALTQPG